MSAHQGKGYLQCLLHQQSPLAKPRGIQAGVVTAGTLVVIHILGDRIEQAPRSIFGRVKVGTAAFTVVELLHLVEYPVIWQLGRVIYRLIDTAEHRLKIVLCLALVDLEFSVGLHAEREVVPLRNGNTQLAFYCTGAELRPVGYLHCLRRAIHRNLQRVVAHHAHRGGCRHGD